MTRLAAAFAAILVFAPAPLLAQSSPNFAASEPAQYVKPNGAVTHWLSCPPSTVDPFTGAVIGTGTSHSHPCRDVTVERDFRPAARTR